jgi:L-ribulokinase
LTAASGAYTIGVDFGTQSGRVLLLDTRTGQEHGVAVVPYASGVIDRALPATGEQLPPDWALQDPDDWVAVLERGIPEALAKTAIGADEVAGMGIDFTSCTVLPTTAEGTPLCTLEQWRGHRHAWPKLWKHHSAQRVADRLNDIALERHEDWLERYGGRISSEWYFPKLIEVWLEDREVYDGCERFIEATDWIVWWLTGSEIRQTATAGFKALWSPADGLPSVDYFVAAYPGFDRPAAKLGERFVPLGTRAGTLRPEVAERIGLADSVAVAVGNVDAWVCFAGAGVERPGVYVPVVGTSTCEMVVHSREILLPGITGVVKDGILPGLYGYEAGQAAVGDMLAWFVQTLGVDGPDGFEALERQAAELAPGQTGLLALGWWNGNRTILADADLTGAIFGLTLHSGPDHLYRALLEAIAFGSRRIIDNFAEHGLAVEEIVAVGGIAERSPLTMQLLADICGLSVSVPASREIPARGSALFGAVAAGLFGDISQAITALRPEVGQTYEPRAEAKETYDAVYAIYRDLYQLLGRTRVELLHRLKRIRLNERKSGVSASPNERRPA